MPSQSAMRSGLAATKSSSEDLEGTARDGFLYQTGRFETRSIGFLDVSYSTSESVITVQLRSSCTKTSTATSRLSSDKLETQEAVEPDEGVHDALSCVICGT